MEQKLKQWTNPGEFGPGHPPAKGVDIPFAKQKDAAAYVASLVFELRQIAQAANLTRVVAPLEKAYYEAFSIGRQLEANGSQPGQTSENEAVVKKTG